MFVLTAYFLRFSDDEVIIGVFIGFICFILVGIKQLERSKALFDVNRRTTLIIKLPLRKMRTFINSRWLDTAICSLMLFFVPVYTWYLSSIHARIPSDILLLAIALLSLLGITYLYSWFVSKKNLKLSGLEKVKDKTILNRLSVYTFNALLVYMSHTSLFKPELFTQVEWIFFVCLGFLVFSIILFGTRPRFETTPMDVLVLLVGALMALALPLIQAEDYSLAIIQFIVLLYGFELILHTDHLIFSSILRWVLFISLFTIVIQGLA